MDAAAWTSFLVLYVCFSSATANQHLRSEHPQLWESYHTFLIWFQLTLLWQKERRGILKEELFLTLTPNLKDIAKCFQNFHHSAALPCKKAGKALNKLNHFLRVRRNCLCCFPKASEQLLSGERCCTSSGEEGCYFKPAVILGFCSWQLHSLAGVVAGSWPWKGKQKILPTLSHHAADATQFLHILMGLNGASPSPHFERSVPWISRAHTDSSSRQKNHQYSPMVTHLTLG